MKKLGSGDILAKKFVMTNLIDYHEGAVVSRTIVDKKSGTVTLFAFDEGQGLSEHSTPYDALVQVIDGRVEIKIDGSPHEVGMGEMIILPAEHPHALRAIGRFKMLLTMVRQEPEPLQVLAL